MSNFRIVSAVLKAQTGKARDKFRAAPETIDKNLPLGIRIGGMVGVDSVPFIIAEATGSIVEPLEGDQLITAYGHWKINNELTMHRFYLEGDNGHMLRVITDASGDIALDDGLILFQQKEVITPSTQKKWNKWLGNPNKPKKSYFIGWETYGIGDDEDPLYWRTVDCEIENDSPAEDECYMAHPQIEPMKFREKLHTDSEGSAVVIPRSMMIYARDIDDGDGSMITEHCTVSSVEGEHGGYVEVLAGISVSKQNLTVI